MTGFALIALNPALPRNASKRADHGDEFSVRRLWIIRLYPTSLEARGESVPMVNCVPVRRKEPVQWGVDDRKRLIDYEFQ